MMEVANTRRQACAEALPLAAAVCSKSARFFHLALVVPESLQGKGSSMRP
jgi:putative CRISPR-associated protein (TIGR02620 family)